MTKASAMHRQDELPGYEGKSIRELNDVTEMKYALGEQISGLRTQLGDLNKKGEELLQKHGIEVYVNRKHAPPLIARHENGKSKFVVEEYKSKSEKSDEKKSDAEATVE